jgi:hypothetical protein
MLFVAIGDIMVKRPNSLKKIHVLMLGLLCGVWGSAEESHHVRSFILATEAIFWRSPVPQK